MLRVLKWVGKVLGGLIGILILVGGIFYLSGRSDVLELRSVSPPISKVVSDSSSIARGAHLTKILSCGVCHGEQLGGKVFLDIPPFKAVASNLTAGKGGIGGNYSDADWDRSIRYGIKPDGKAMHVMPANLFHSLSDADANALITYLKTIPAVDNQLPASEPRLPLFLMAGAPGQEAYPNVRAQDDYRQPPVEIAETAAYGAYLTRLSCVECHGLDLRGGEYPEPGAPGGPDLAVAGQWPLEAFTRALREGKTPYGTELRDKYMPWNSSYKHMTDLEIKALHLYLGSLGD